MRVVVVTTWFPDPDRPGVAPFVPAHVRAIAARNDVQIVHLALGSGSRARIDQFEGLPVARIPVDPRSPRGLADALRRLRAAVDGADVVHTMAFSTLGVVAPLYPWISSRWVHSEHWSGVAHPERVPGSWRRLAAARHLLRLPRRVSAVSTAFAGALAEFTRSGAVDVVPNVVRDGRPAVPPPADEVLRLVAVGGLVPGKRPLLAVDTVRALMDSGQAVTLDWVGGGPLRDTASAHARDLGVSEQVRLVGHVDPADVADHLDRADLFFLPTAFETFLVSAAEALARGRPVVLPAGGPYTDFVDDAVGVLATDETPAGLAAAVRTARSRFSGVPVDRFRSAVLPRFGSDRIGQDFETFYERAVG